MANPIKPRLWEIVQPALTPSRLAGQKHLASKRYAAREEVREYRESDQGWPLVVGDRLVLSGQPKWRSMFSLTTSQFSQVLAGDVPELETAMRLAVSLSRDDNEVGEGISFWYRHEDTDKRDHYLKVDFLSMIGDILGRAEALGIDDDDRLFDLYLEVERGRFSPTLAGDVVMPLVLTTFETETPVHLVDSFWIEPLGVPEHRARALSSLTNGPVSPHIAAAATHAVVKRNCEFNNISWPPDFRLGSGKSPVPLDSFEQILQSIYVVTGQKTGYAQIYVRPDGWVPWTGWVGSLPTVWNAVTEKGYPDDFEGGWLRPMERISDRDTADIVTAATTLSRSPNNVQIAARRCARSMYRDDYEDEVLDAAIGVEALLSNGRDELTHRMSQRAAVALAASFPPDVIYNLVKQVYGQRSRIVHGSKVKEMTVKLGDSSASTNHMAVFLLRELLRNYLVGGEAWTPEALDELIIERLSVDWHRNDSEVACSDS